MLNPQFSAHSQNQPSVLKEIFDLLVLSAATEDDSGRRLVSLRTYAESGRLLDTLHYDIGVKVSVFDSLSDPSDDMKILRARYGEYDKRFC